MRNHQSDPLARIGGEQGTLFNLPPETHLVYGGEPPARRGSETSKAAAEAQSAKAPSVRMKLLAWIRAQAEHGATAEEAGAHLATLRGLPPETPACRLTAAARLTELKLGGLVCDSGRRRQTSGNCPAVVWVATDKAGDGRVCESQR